MLIGPVFSREITIAPRRERTFILRSVYAAVLILLISTAWLVISGTQLITDPGDMARFGAMLFQFLAPIQLVLTLFLAATLAAGAVGQEKERKTLQLLLLTRMSHSELVLGKLFASLLNLLMMLAISVPIFMTIALLGGISYYQIVRMLLVALFSMIAAGSLGSCMALWREKTFQAIASTILALVIWIGLWEAVGLGLFGPQILGIASETLSSEKLASAFSPWNAVLVASRPAVDAHVASLTAADIVWTAIHPIAGFLAFCGLTVLGINAVTILRVRAWNSTQDNQSVRSDENRTEKSRVDRDTWKKSQTAEQTLVDTMTVDEVTQLEEEQAALSEPPIAEGTKTDALAGRVRHPWNNPVVWREMMTQAYGRRIGIIQFGFLAFFAMCAWALHQTLVENWNASVSQLSGPLIPLFLLSLILVNVQAITSQTSEKDAGTFDLLLTTDITPREYVFGKLIGIAFNMKWTLLLPLLLCGYLYYQEALSGTSLLFLLVGLIVLYVFVATVGVYIGMQYDNTRAAIATSLGIVFFLFVGIAACIWIMVAFSGSFETQLVPFSAFMIGGGIGLYITLGARNPSAAIASSSFILPIGVFYLITSMLLGKYFLVFVVLTGAFGFTTLAMLIPLIAEFDVATGRTTAD